MNSWHPEPIPGMLCIHPNCHAQVTDQNKDHFTLGTKTGELWCPHHTPKPKEQNVQNA